MPNRSSPSILGRLSLLLPLLAACSQGGNIGAGGDTGDVGGKYPAPAFASIGKGQEGKRIALPVTASPEESAALLAKNEDLKAFLANEGKGWEITFDRRSGQPMLLQGPGIAWMPGAGNSLDAASTLGSGFLSQPVKDQALVLAAHGESKARALIGSRKSLLGFDASALVLDRTWTGSPDGNNEQFLVTFRHQPGGVEQHDARLTFVVNHGNLIQIHSERMLPASADLAPRLTDAQAFEKLRKDSEITALPKILGVDLKVVHLAPVAGLAPGAFSGTLGQGYESHLAYVFHFVVNDDTKTYGAFVDAQSGRVLELFDDNKYVGGVTGGIYPRTIAGTETLVPFVNTAVTNGSAQTTDLGGNYNYGSGTASTTLGGTFLSVSDNCGAPAANATSAPGDILVGTSAATDCSFSATGHSTRAARNAFYHLNNVRRMGQKWLGGVNAKATSWFATDVRVNVNISDTCNAYWDGSSVNFFKSGGGCANTGEISDVMQHEWGHGLDSNTKSGSVGDSAKGEAVADTVALLMTHDSCVGPGFLPSGGETPACSTGVRDLTFSVTAANIATKCSRSSSCAGALGYECHCESHILSGAHWKLAQLFVTRYGAAEGWDRFEKGYLRAFQNITAYSIGAAGNAYDAWMAADDDNGNITDGTPNADIIFQAFSAQAIAGTQRAAHSAVCTTTPGAPTVTATGGTGAIALSWNAIAGSTYTITRTQAHTDGQGFLPLATNLATNSYSDAQVRPGFPYTYQVQAVAGGCSSPLGAGVTATATAGTSTNDFTLALGSSTSTVAAGSSTTVSVTTAVSSGSAQTISLSVSGLPAGVTGSFSPSSVSAGGTSTLTLTAASSAAAATATYTVTGTATSGSKTANGSLTVTTGTPASNFSISVASTPNTVPAGGSIAVTVSTALVSGAAQTIALSVSGLPAGVTGTFSPASVTAGSVSTLTLSAASSAAAATATYTVTGSSSTTSHTATGSLTVTTTAPASNFSIAIASTPNTVAAGASIAVAVSTAVVSGAAQSISLAVSGLPAGVTGSFSPASVTTGGSSTLTLTASASAPAVTAASYTVTGSSPTTSHAVSAALTVTTVPTSNAIVNGNFETGSLSGWTVSGTASITSGSYEGNWAAFVGGSNPTNGDSSITQTFTAPAAGGTLSFFYSVRCPDTITYDWATATLKNNSTGVTTAVLPKVCNNSGAWVQVNAALVGGTSYTLSLTSHDDGFFGDATHALFDAVTIAAVSTSGGIVNGGFDNGTFGGWTTTGTTMITNVSHSGGYAAVVGSPNPTNGDSTLSQTFTAPAGKSQLSLYYANNCPDTVTWDWAIVTLKDNTANTTATMLPKSCADAYQWTHLTSPVTPGHSYTLKILNHDDNYYADPNYTLVDDVVLQ